jgi:hypothetical protein
LLLSSPGRLLDREDLTANQQLRLANIVHKRLVDIHGVGFGVNAGLLTGGLVSEIIPSGARTSMAGAAQPAGENPIGISSVPPSRSNV